MFEEFERLSEREHAVLRLMTGGLADKEIAADLGLSIHTAIGYKKSAFLKLDVYTKAAAAAAYALYEAAHHQSGPRK
jgi:DNA-binding CsgD family transcriptional regulator